MAENVRFESVAPIIPVKDLDATLSRYRDLGFDIELSDPPHRYGFAERGDVHLHFSEWAGHDPARTGASVYIYVSDADAVYAEWVASGVGGRFGEPFDADWGLREFSFVDPEGTAHRVGSPLGSPTE